MISYNLDITKESIWKINSNNYIDNSLPFHLTEVGKFYANQNYYTARSEKEGYLLIYTFSGSGVMSFEDKPDISLLPHEALIIECKNYHVYKTTSIEPWGTYWIHFDGQGVKPYYEIINNQPINLVSISDDFENMLKLSNNIDLASSIKICQNILNILTSMTTSFLGETTQNISYQKDIKFAIDFIENNYQNSITIDDIVKDINISKFHFIRLFKKHIGTTPYNYITNYRINTAKRLLCTTDHSISEISYLVGYTSESNFILHFNKLTNSTPSQFRKSNINYIK